MLRWPLPMFFDRMRFARDDLCKTAERGAILQSPSRREGRSRPIPERNERFAPFFERRELALRVDLRSPADGCEVERFDLAAENAGRVAAFIAIRLERRRSRLDFLYRVRRAIEDSEANRLSMVGMDEQDKRFFPLEYVGDCFEVGDHAYVAEGWADFLLVLVGDIKQRLESVFDIQHAIFGDFMVHRTETFLDPLAVNAVLERDTGFTVAQTIRSIEDISAEDVGYRFIQRVHEQAHQYADDSDGLDILRTPGRTDHEIRYSIPWLKRTYHSWLCHSETAQAMRREEIEPPAVAFLYDLLRDTPVEEVITKVSCVEEIRGQEASEST